MFTKAQPPLILIPLEKPWVLDEAISKQHEDTERTEDVYVPVMPADTLMVSQQQHDVELLGQEQVCCCLLML